MIEIINKNLSNPKKTQTLRQKTLPEKTKSSLSKTNLLKFQKTISPSKTIKFVPSAKSLTTGS